MLAGAILAKVDRGEIALETVVRYTADDVLSNSPVTELQVGAGSMTIEALCQSAVEVSDNTAANLLLPLIGNPSGLTAYLRTLGDRVTRLDRNETGLNTNVQGDARDTTTPNSMVKIMRELLVRDALSPKSKDKLIGWMKNCRTGTARIRAGLPPTWIAGDKTGTGANGAVNDVAIIWPPNHTAILVAAYLTGSLSPLDTLNAVQSTIGAIVTKQFAI
jgi:beta-lactamase class A